MLETSYSITGKVRPSPADPQVSSIARFRIAKDDNGEPECFMASRSVERYSDALFIYDRCSITGARVLADDGGGVVWMKNSSSLEEVVQDLLGLPEPSEPGAPTLVKRQGALWTMM